MFCIESGDPPALSSRLPGEAPDMLNERCFLEKKPIDELILIPRKEKIMKIYALLIVMTVALAGCSTSYKGSIQSSSPEAAKNGNYVASHSGTNQSGADVYK